MAALLLITWLVYHPGLSGNFLFDDYFNLTALGATGPVHDWPSFLRYITSGKADPTGRPLTMLTFLLNAQDWPANPYWFKVTNVLLHLLNGALLCCAMRALGTQAGLDKTHAGTAALLGAAFWLLHPLFVSTTLYIVQREAMLPATFTFCGLLCWCVGRRRFDEGRSGSGRWWLLAGGWLCTALATLCKANGILLPLLIAAAECTILRSREAKTEDAGSRSLHRARRWVLGIPLVALVAVLIGEIPSSIHAAAAYRPWTIGQRLLTEPRVLMDYLRLLWVPRATSFGLFNDQVRASVDVLHPWTTLPCILAIVALIVGAWLLRTRYRFVAFAILFYFGGQLLESGLLPLELAFEHRNYLPAAFMFWPLAIWLTAAGGFRVIRIAFVLLALTGLSMLTYARATVWGDEVRQALIWGKINPHSGRAQALAAMAEAAMGDPGHAIKRLQNAAVGNPSDVQLTLNLASIECKAGMFVPSTWQRVLYSLRHTRENSSLLLNWFAEIIPLVANHDCNGLSLNMLQQAVAAARANPKFGYPGPRQNFDHIAGLLALAMHQPELALQQFDDALAASPNHDTALEQAATLGASGYPVEGLQHLDFAQTQTPRMKPALGMPMAHVWVLQQQHYWQHETARLRATLEADAARRANDGATAPAARHEPARED